MATTELNSELIRNLKGTFSDNKGILRHLHRNKSSAVAEMGDRLTTIDMGRKVGAVDLFPWGSGVPIQHNVACAEAYLCTKWNFDT